MSEKPKEVKNLETIVKTPGMIITTVEFALIELINRHEKELVRLENEIMGLKIANKLNGARY